MIKNALLLIALPWLSEAAGGLLQLRESACADVHVFLLRGNNEPYPGRQGKLVTAICSGLQSCDYEDIQFYNPLESVYCDSVYEAAINGVAQVTAYNARCPKAKLVLSGYSQGAHALGDLLGGGGGVFYNGCVEKSTPALDVNSSAGKMVVAALIFGDTRHTAGQSYNYETGANYDGLFPRTGDLVVGLNKYASVIRSYCVVTDPVCAQGKLVETHLNYFDVFTDGAAAWVKKMADVTATAITTAVTTTATSVSSATSSLGVSTGLPSLSLPVSSSIVPGASTTPTAIPSSVSNVAASASTSSTSGSRRLLSSAQTYQNYITLISIAIVGLIASHL